MQVNLPPVSKGMKWFFIFLASFLVGWMLYSLGGGLGGEHSTVSATLGGFMMFFSGGMLAIITIVAVVKDFGIDEGDE